MMSDNHFLAEMGSSDCDGWPGAAGNNLRPRTRMGGVPLIAHIERITCDNPDCVVYVEELIREEPGRYQLVEYVRSQLAAKGWTQKGDRDFCPLH
jgi:hypothetical protein